MRGIHLLAIAFLAAMAAICVSCTKSTDTEFDEDDPSIARDVKYINFWMTNYVKVSGEDSGEIYEGGMAFTFNQYVGGDNDNSNIRVTKKGGLIHYECEGNQKLEYDIQEIKQNFTATLSFDIDPESKVAKNLVFKMNGTETRVIEVPGWLTEDVQIDYRRHVALGDFPFKTYNDSKKEAKYTVAEGLEYYDYLTEVDMRVKIRDSNEPADLSQTVNVLTNDPRDYVWLTIEYVK